MESIAFAGRAAVKAALPIACLSFSLAGCSGNAALPNDQPATGPSLSQLGSKSFGSVKPLYPVTGANPWGSLVKIGTKFYGLAREGGANQYGAIFKLTTGGTEAVIYSFNSSDGTYPTGSLAHIGSALYGVTPSGGMNGAGTVFKKGINGGGGFTVLHNFNGTDGSSAVGVQKVGNVLYGVTYQGGTHNDGTIFKMNTSGGGFTTLYNFGATSTDGAWPSSMLTQIGSSLYGVTYTGGAHTYGTIYKITTAGVYTQLYSFAGGNDGVFPSSNLVAGNNVLYGTTVQGGSSAALGTVYKYTLAGVETVLHVFSTSTCDGAYPIGDLVKTSNLLYGTAQSGTTACGTAQGVLFSVPIAGGADTVLHQFQGTPSDGQTPNGGILKVGNALYGTTIMGGANNYGTVFKTTLSGSPESLLYSF